MSTFGKKIRAFRIEHGKSLREFADDTKMTATTVKKVEDGGMPSLLIFAALVKATKYDVAQALKDVVRGRAS